MVKYEYFELWPELFAAIFSEFLFNYKNIDIRYSKMKSNKFFPLFYIPNNGVF